jgi:predicted transcriptional regulator of viral defense system
VVPAGYMQRGVPDYDGRCRKGRYRVIILTVGETADKTLPSEYTQVYLEFAHTTYVSIISLRYLTFIVPFFSVPAPTRNRW